MKTRKNGHLFYNTVSLKKPHSYYEPQVTQHYSKAAKEIFLVGARNKICTEPFLDV